MNYRVFFLIIIIGFAFACGGSQKVETRTIKHDEYNADGHQKLPDGVAPTNYVLDLSIDASKDTFSGSVQIDVEVTKPTVAIYMHSDELTIDRVALSAGDKTIAVEVVPGVNGGIALAAHEELKPGAYVISMEFTGPLDEVPTGLYRVKDGEGWYAFTQFEPLEARQAFPSFDEPRFKATFETTLRVPTGQLAATNAPQASKTTEGATDVYTFAKTKPLPTYLVAFATGDFDVVEAEADAIPGVPFRILATKGKGKLAEWMLKRTPPIVSLLTDYFGMPFPYEKLDVVAVPNSSSGAMENVGLITFRERLVLIDDESASLSVKRSALSVMSHELAHMWFGNLVTLPWWDELWLNESFATWMAAKSLEKLAPQLEAKIDGIGGKGWIIGIDSLVQARAIRQPIKHGGDVYNAFDGLTYGKGARVLLMIEAWIGEETMQKGIQAYLAKHLHATGTTESLLTELDKASGKPVSAMISTFIDQPGAPLLEMTPSCEGDAPTVSIKQSRFLPPNSQADPGKPWNVPVCIRYAEGRGTAVHCALVDAPEKTITLPAKKCPKWIYPDANEVGYYRWTLPSADINALVKKHRRHLTTAEKVGLLANIKSLANAQKIDSIDYLKAIQELGKENHRVIVEDVIGAYYPIESMIPDESRKKFNKKMSAILSARARKLGWKARKNEKPDVSLLRPRVLMAHAKLSDDKKTKKQAAELSKKFLGDMTSVESNLASVSTRIAAWDAGADLWLSYKMALQQAPTPTAKSALLRGLGSFKDVELQKRSLQLLLDGTVRSQDFWTLFGPMLDRDENRAVAWAWFTANYPKIVEKLGEKSAPRLPRVAGAFCTAEAKQMVEEFFAPAERRPAGADRNLANGLEAAEQCIQRRQYLKPAVDEWLK